ncbi:MAG: hypothetical protein FalmKO_32600 [Falsiruegeria mediterranea]
MSTPLVRREAAKVVRLQIGQTARVAQGMHRLRFPDESQLWAVRQIVRSQPPLKCENMPALTRPAID